MTMLKQKEIVIYCNFITNFISKMEKIRKTISKNKPKKGVSKLVLESESEDDIFSKKV